MGFEEEIRNLSNQDMIDIRTGISDALTAYQTDLIYRGQS